MIIQDEKSMNAFGAALGARLHGGEVIELVGDVGAGKTTLTKGIALGMGIDDDVQSPSFTISRVYTTSTGKRLAHYDFYRLSEAGIMKDEIDEDLNDSDTSVVIEWGGSVEDVLPANRLKIMISSTSEDTRRLDFTGNDELIKGIVTS